MLAREISSFFGRSSRDKEIWNRPRCEHFPHRIPPPTGMSSQVPPKAPQVATGSRHRNSKKRAEEWWNGKKLAWPLLAAAVFAYACWEESSKSASR